MQVEYRKEQNDTYLWILAEGEQKEAFTEQMLLHNPGEGRLEFSKQHRNGEEYYCYKITGKKALGSIYSAISIGERQIRGILSQLFLALERGKEYLLMEEDFVLDPGYVFATLPQMELALCYVPGYGVPLKEQLEGFFEYLLNRVDYEDRAAVELLYDCYMLCMREQGGPEEIKRRLGFFETDIAATGDAGKEEEIFPDRSQMREREEIIERKEEEQGKPATYFSWLTDFLFSKRRKEIPVLTEKKEEYQAVKQNREILQEEKTVLLASIQERNELVLINRTTGEAVAVNKFPFYIGSVSEYSDYVLKKNGVSRMHCCIKKKGEKYLLSDLNSTNGTYLDGKEVIPGTDATLSQNSIICIAEIEFSADFSCH